MRDEWMEHEIPDATFTFLTLINAAPDNEKGKKENWTGNPGTAPYSMIQVNLKVRH